MFNFSLYLHCSIKQKGLEKNIKQVILIVKQILPIVIIQEKYGEFTTLDSLLRRGLFVSWGGQGKKKKKARGARFSLFPSYSTRFLFFDYCYFYWDSQREPASAEERATLESRRKLEPKSFPQLFLDFTIGRSDGSEIVASKMNQRSFGLYQDYSNSL